VRRWKKVSWKPRGRRTSGTGGTDVRNPVGPGHSVRRGGGSTDLIAFHGKLGPIAAREESPRGRTAGAGIVKGRVYSSIQSVT